MHSHPYSVTGAHMRGVSDAHTVMSTTAIRTSLGWREFGPCGATSDDDDAKADWLPQWFANTYGPFLIKPVVKLSVVLVFCVFFVVQTSLWFEEVTYGTRNSDIVKDDTYQRDFYVRHEDDYVLYAADFITRSADFSVRHLPSLPLSSVCAGCCLMMPARLDRSLAGNHACVRFTVHASVLVSR